VWPWDAHLSTVGCDLGACIVGGSVASAFTAREWRRCRRAVGVAWRAHVPGINKCTSGTAGCGGGAEWWRHWAHPVVWRRCGRVTNNINGVTHMTSAPARVVKVLSNKLQWRHLQVRHQWGKGHAHCR